MYSELYQKKNQYENFIKNLTDISKKLEICYANLILCKKKMNETLKNDNKYYNSVEFENIINNIKETQNKIQLFVLPKARYEYNNILSEITKL